MRLPFLFRGSCRRGRGRRRSLEEESRRTGLLEPLQEETSFPGPGCPGGTVPDALRPELLDVRTGEGERGIVQGEPDELQATLQLLQVLGDSFRSRELHRCIW